MALHALIRARLEDHFGHGDCGHAKGADATKRRLLDQQGRVADGHQIEECLVDLDCEIGAIEMALDQLGRVVERLGESGPGDRIDGKARHQTEPLRPRRGQLGQKRCRQLLDRIGRGAIEQPLGVIARRLELGAEASAPLWLAIGIAVPPKCLPRPAAAQRSLVAEHDGLKRELGHADNSNHRCGHAARRSAAEKISTHDV